MVIDIVDYIKVTVVTFITLFPVVNPIGDAPIFLSLTERYPEALQKVLARKIAIYGFAILVISLLIGSEILAALGVTLFVVQIAGGLVVASTGWSLLNKQDTEPTEKAGAATLEDALEHAFFPLTLPLTVGPGCISIAITLGAHLRHQTAIGFEHGYPRRFLAALTGMVLICISIYICYGNAERLVRLLGKSGTNILMRLSAFILVVIGVQIMWNGISTGVQQLMHH
jgi:multiple antibiotic resistance protein